MSRFLTMFLPLYISLALALQKPTATINPRQLLGEGGGLSQGPPVITFVTTSTSTEPPASSVDPTALYASLETYAPPTNASAIYASRTKAYAQDISQFFRTAEPTAAAAVSSELAAQSSWDAAYSEYATYTGTDDLLGYSEPTNASAIYASETKARAATISQFFRTAVSTARAALSSDLAAQSSFEDKFEKFLTYTGTSDILGSETASANSSRVSRTSAAAVATSTAWNIDVAPTSQEHWPDVAYAGIEAAYGVDCRLPPHNGAKRTYDTSDCNEMIPKICKSYIEPFRFLPFYPSHRDHALQCKSKTSLEHQRNHVFETTTQRTLGKKKTLTSSFYTHRYIPHRRERWPNRQHR